MFSSRSFLIAVGVAFLAGMVVSLAVRSSGGEKAPRINNDTLKEIVRERWRVPLSSPRNLPGNGETPVWLVNAVQEATGGSFIIDLFDPGEIVPAFAITDAVRDRKVPAGYTWLGYDQGKIPASALIAAKPFGMEPWAFIGWWLHGGGKELSEKIYVKHNMKPLLCGISGPETAGWFAQPLKSVDDLDGLKIRFAGLGGKAMQRVGASVTMLPAGEIFQALETGVIDATEYSQPITDQALGFNRIAKYNYYPGWHQPFSSIHMVVNLQVWDALAASDQSMLEDLCLAATAFHLGLSEALQGPVIEKFENVGVSARHLPDDMLEKIHDAANEVLDEEAIKDEDFAEVLASQRAFHKTYRKWRNLAYLSKDFDQE